MLEKTKEKRRRAARSDTWVGYSPQYGPTKKEKLKKIERKHKKPLDTLD